MIEQWRTITSVVIGSREGITETMHQFHVLGYAEVSAWSSILPVPNSSEVMSILTKYRVD